MDQTFCLDALEKKKISCPCRESVVSESLLVGIQLKFLFKCGISGSHGPTTTHKRYFASQLPCNVHFRSYSNACFITIRQAYYPPIGIMTVTMESDRGSIVGRRIFSPAFNPVGNQKPFHGSRQLEGADKCGEQNSTGLSLPLSLMMLDDLSVNPLLNDIITFSA